MAKNLYFSRDSKAYLEFAGAVWEIPVLDGFSFSQSTNTSEITLSEMQDSSGLSRRGRRVFTDSLAPVEWSFSTYVRPYINSSQHSAVEAALWALMAGADTFTGTNTGALATLTLTTNIDAGVAGTYRVYPTTSGAGKGAVLDIIVTGAVVTNISSVTIINPGTGYAATDTLTIDGDLLGDTSGNLVLTVSTVVQGTSDFIRSVNIDTNNSADGTVFTSGSNNATLKFNQSNRSVLSTANLYFVMSTNPDRPMVYKIKNAVINEASLDFEVDGIATINWSGSGAEIIDLQSTGKVSVGTEDPTANLETGKIFIESDATPSPLFKVYGASAWISAIRTGAAATSNFIRNRLTQLLITAEDTAVFPGVGSSGVYNLTITGGNITISNNISYLTPEELGKVNIPIEHVTGARSITGSFTSYLTFDTSSNDGTSSDFFNDLTATNALSKVVNDFDVTFQIGGNVTDTARLYVNIPKCHIEVPNHSIEDVISIETNFSAYTTDFSVANEVNLTYYGVTVT